MTVAVVTCLYGDGYERFLPAWLAAVHALERQPDEIIIATDTYFDTDDATIVRSLIRDWRYPQPFHLQLAFTAADSEWVWHLDLDDEAFPDALNGIDSVAADVWQMGYERDDGLHHVPPQLTADEYLALTGNPFVHASPIRAEVFRRCGGYPDIAFEDWGLWRRLARNGCTFQSSGRTHFRYAQGPYTRTNVDLAATARSLHVEEMLASEHA